jgi:phospholipid/cholesterol/gamma-HCH transport system substrate-binding protein
MSERSRLAKEISVGAVVSVGIIVFAVAVMAISKESRLFVPRDTYWTRFENTSGLGEGSPVRLVGVQIGTVEEIEFPEDIRESKIKVTFSVDRAFATRIRAGTQAYLKSLTYLSNEKYVELTPGDPDQDRLAVGGFVEPGISVWEETLQQSQGIADDVKEITASLRDLLVAINRGGGIVQEMIHNPEFGRQGVANLEGSLSALRRTLEGVEKGRGLAGVVMTDEVFARKQAEHIDATLAHLRSVMEKLDSDTGAVAALTAPDGPGVKAVEDLRSATAALRRVASRLDEGRGLVGRVVNDEDYASALLKKIDGTVGHAESILRKVDSGEGTLGGIVNDPEVYEGLRDVVAGINKSKIGKSMIRRYGKSGAEERARQAGEGDDENTGQAPDGGNPAPKPDENP